MSTEDNNAAARQHLDTILRNDYTILPQGMTPSFQAHARGNMVVMDVIRFDRFEGGLLAET